MSGTTATLTNNRDLAARVGIRPQPIDAIRYGTFGQRQVTQNITSAPAT